MNLLRFIPPSKIGCGIGERWHPRPINPATSINDATIILFIFTIDLKEASKFQPFHKLSHSVLTALKIQPTHYVPINNLSETPFFINEEAEGHLARGHE